MHLSSLTVDARFALDLAAAEVTLPFQVFAGKPGTSRWKSSALSVTQGIYATYFAAVVDEEHARNQEDAVDHAFAYAKARIALESAAATAGNFQARSALDALLPEAQAAESSSDCTEYDTPIKVVHNGRASDLLLYYSGCGLPVHVLLQPIVDQPGIVALTRAPLSGDPRVFIDPLNPREGRDDPPSKSVLIFAPYVAQGNTGMPIRPIEMLTDMSDYEEGAATPAPDPAKFSILPALRAHGYDTKNFLIDSGASVVGLVKALTADPTPGVVILDSHGGSEGGIATGDNWQLAVPAHGAFRRCGPAIGRICRSCAQPGFRI